MHEAGVAADDRLDRDEVRQVSRRSLAMLDGHRTQLIAAASLMVLWTLTTLAGPLLIRYGIDQGIVEADRNALRNAAIGYAVIMVVGYLAFRAQVLAVAKIGEQFLYQLRLRAFAHLQRLSMSFYDREKAGVLVSRLTSDIDAVAELLQMGLLMLVTNSLLLVLAIIVLGLVSWQLLLVCLLALPGVVVASRKFQRDSNERYLEVRDRIGSTLAQLQEGISGVRVVQAHGAEDRETVRFAEGNGKLYRAHLDSVWVQAWYLSVIELSSLVTTAVVVLVGGLMVGEGIATIGTVAFFILTLSNLFEPVQQLSQLFNMLQSAGAGLRKVYGLLDEEVELGERPGAVDLPTSGDLELDGVRFAYGDGPTVVDDVDLVIHEGERLALVGPTGAGKSTVAKLAARFYDPVEGAVRYGGVDLRDATMASLRERMVVVPQEGFLFNGTIADNIRLARWDASEREIEEALARLGLRPWLGSLDEGLATEVRERGTRLSAGERQLVSLARAALVDPSVLVLDEATSSLDPGTEQLVENALDRLVAHRTVIVIAHRLSTASRADRVGVVAGGRVVELGPHEHLLEQDGRYAALYRSWMASVGSSTPAAGG